MFKLIYIRTVYMPFHKLHWRTTAIHRHRTHAYELTCGFVRQLVGSQLVGSASYAIIRRAQELDAGNVNQN